MGEVFENANRRTILQKGFLFLAGMAGLKLVENQAGAQPPPVPRGQTLRFYTQPRSVHPHGVPGKLAAARRSRMMACGELREVPKGAKVGDYYSTCFSLGSPFGPNPQASSNLEIQTLKIKDGTLFGIAAPEGSIEGSVHAIVGGTGRYAGARGQFSSLPANGGADRGTVEIVVTLLS